MADQDDVALLVEECRDGDIERVKSAGEEQHVLDVVPREQGLARLRREAELLSAGGWCPAELKRVVVL